MIRLRLVAPLLAVAVAIAGCSSSHPSAKPSPSQLNDQVSAGGTYAGLALDPPQPRPSFTLTDTAGQSFSFGQQTAGHPTLLYFGYTNCPDICPETLFDMHTALTKLPTATQQQVYVVFVTTDVKRDTAPVIKQWLSNFSTGTSAHFVGLRGSQAQIDAAQAAAHITVAEDAGQTHSAQVLLFSPDNYAHVTFVQSTTEAQQMEHDLKVVAQG